MTLARSASDRIQKVQTSVNLIDLVKSILTSNYHLLANIGLDIAENGPLKVCQEIATCLKKVIISIG